VSARYQSARAFQQALEERLRRKPGPINRHRDLLGIQRLLARIVALNPSVLLKGGMGLKLRTPHARATKDLDLRIEGELDEVSSCLRRAAQLTGGDYRDYMEFAVRYVKRLVGTDGHRFHAECTLGGRPFSSFDVDVVRPEPIHGEVEELPGADWLSFAEIPTPIFRVYPRATQLAEKLHALTSPRARANTRVKDLPDILVLASLEGPTSLTMETLRRAIASTFAFRATHEVPARFPELQPEWAVPYVRLLESPLLLQWQSFTEAIGLVRRFLDPVLAGTSEGVWSPLDWEWR
jgi:hypothetical protein